MCVSTRRMCTYVHTYDEHSLSSLALSTKFPLRLAVQICAQKNTFVRVYYFSKFQPLCKHPSTATITCRCLMTATSRVSYCRDGPELARSSIGSTSRRFWKVAVDREIRARGCSTSFLARLVFLPHESVSLLMLG